MNSIDGYRGRAWRTPTPQGSRFFRFDIQIFQNVSASGVHAPLTRSTPPTGNPGSATEQLIFFRAMLSRIKQKIVAKVNVKNY